MLGREFIKVLKDTPFYCPHFEVTGVPEWASEFIQKGDQGYWCNGALVINGTRLGLGPTYLKFIGYKAMA